MQQSSKAPSLWKRTKDFLSNYDNRYCCAICNTPVDLQYVPGKKSYFYKIYCPACNLVLVSYPTGKREEMFPSALRRGYIKPIDK